MLHHKHMHVNYFIVHAKVEVLPSASLVRNGNVVRKARNMQHYSGCLTMSLT